MPRKHKTVEHETAKSILLSKHVSPLTNTVKSLHTSDISSLKLGCKLQNKGECTVSTAPKIFGFLLYLGEYSVAGTTCVVLFTMQKELIA